RFVDPQIGRYVAPWSRNTGFLRTSRSATRFTSYGGYTVNRGLPVDVVQRSVRRPIARVPIVDVAAARDIPSMRNRGFAAFRPNVTARTARRFVQPTPQRPVDRRVTTFESRAGRSAATPVRASRPVQRVQSHVTTRPTVVAPRVDARLQSRHSV